MEPREREISLGGLRFRYLEWGDSGSPALVLLHGFGTHARSWDHVAGAMADRFRVLALDQRGHGNSDRAPDGDYTVKAMAGDVEAFAEDRKSTRLNSSHIQKSRMPSSA